MKATSPFAGIVTALGIGKTMSGFAMFHPSARCGGGGASCGLPAGAPAATHASTVATCCGVSEGSLEKCPNRGSANHGGIIPFWIDLAIAGAHRRVCSYVTRGMGATLLGR